MTRGLTVDSIQTCEPFRSRTVPRPRHVWPERTVENNVCLPRRLSISNGATSPNRLPTASAAEYPNSVAAESAQSVMRLSRSVANTASGMSLMVISRMSGAPSRLLGVRPRPRGCAQLRDVRRAVDSWAQHGSDRDEVPWSWLRFRQPFK